MRREIVKEIKWLVGGSVALELIAVGNALPPSNTGKAVAAGITGLVMAAGAGIEYLVEKRRETSRPQRRNLP